MCGKVSLLSDIWLLLISHHFLLVKITVELLDFLDELFVIDHSLLPSLVHPLFVLIGSLGS